MTAEQRAEWQRVAQCESGGNWTLHGTTYSGALGISNVNWTAYSAGLGFPANAGDATEDEQIVVAERIEGNGWVPDQSGVCQAW